jgi:PAS domain S-box-containing protein
VLPVVGQDRISERRLAEETLWETTDTLSAIIQASPMGIAILDVEGNVTLWNPAAERIFGWKKEEVLGRPLPAVPPDKREEHRALRERVLRDEAFTGMEVIHRKQDGSPIHISLSTAPLRDAAGRVCGIMSLMADITERKRTEEELRKAEEQLRQVQKMDSIGQLAGGIAHDFNNLLTVITGYSDLLLQGLKADDPHRASIEQIRSAGERATALTRQLLAFSRRQVLEPKVLDLNAVVANVEKMLRRLIGEDISYVSVLSPGLGRVKADPGQIEQVILNLIVNARDAMPQGGKLTVETANVELDDTYVRKHVGAKPGPHVLLAVSDTGHGMDAETQKRVFEPFFTTKEKGKGTGLGLSTVYGIVKQSGGSVWVYSEIGKGTTFKVYLPRIEEGVDARSSGAVQVDPVRGSETILLVEDDESVRELVRSFLQAGGYAVLTVRDTDAALQICEQRQSPIRLLITDVVMPGMSGRDLAERLTAVNPSTKVLYMSGYTDDAVVRHGVLEPGITFLQKPFSADALLRKVREVLDAPSGPKGG